MKKKNETYWIEDKVKESILKFCQAQSQEERNTIWEQELHVVFSKMVENIFNTFKFQYMEVGHDSVQKDVLTHLCQNLEKYNPASGFKSFSYFSVVCKNYLIALNNTNYKKWNKTMELACDYDMNEEIPKYIPTVIDDNEEIDIMDFILQLRQYYKKVSVVHSFLFDNCILNQFIHVIDVNKYQLQTESHGLHKKIFDGSRNFRSNRINKVIGHCYNFRHLIKEIRTESYQLYQYYLLNATLTENRIIKGKKVNEEVLNRIITHKVTLERMAYEADKKICDRLEDEDMFSLLQEIKNK